MQLHPRAKIVRQAQAQFALELLNSPALKQLTYVERTMVLSSVLSDEINDYIKYDLRVERHGCQHIKADEYHEALAGSAKRSKRMMSIDPRAKTARKKFGNGIPPVYRIALDRCRNPCPHTGWQPKTVLDYGCGYARFADDFMRAGVFYVGTDLHRQDFSDQPLFEEALAHEDGRGKAGYISSEFLHLCQGYDLVLLSNVVNIQETTEQLMTLIRDAFRLVGKGGSVLLNYPRSPRRLDLSFKALKDLIYWEWLDRRVMILDDHEHESVLRLLK